MIDFILYGAREGLTAIAVGIIWCFIVGFIADVIGYRDDEDGS